MSNFNLEGKMSRFRKNDIFNEVFGHTLATQLNEPRANVTRQKNGILLDVELPGLSRSEIELDIRDGILTVTAQSTDADRDYERREFGAALTKRSWSLPKGADSERIEATHESGILSINIPYRTGTNENHRKIEIR